MRCRRTGLAISMMSSVLTCVRPLSNARVLPPSSKHWTARGPAPQLSQSLMKSGVPGWRTRVWRALADDALQFDDVVVVEDRFDGVVVDTGRLLRDLLFFGEVRIADVDFEHEPVLLSFRQSVRPFLLDGVLRGKHEKRIGQNVPRLSDGDLPFLHGFQQRGLSLRRRAVDFVGQDDVVKQRAVDEAKLALAGAFVFLQNFGAGDVGGHQVGSELDAGERHRQAASERADHQRLGEARHTFEQTVSTAKQGDEQLVDDVVLSDNDLRHLLANFPIALAEFLDGFSCCRLCRLDVVAHEPPKLLFF